MKFYIASKLENFKAVQILSAKLKSAGWVYTYDWTVDASEKVTNIDILKDIGVKECEGVKNADIVIVLTPQGGGAHTELGMAIALNKKIFVCHNDDTYFKCDSNTSPFYWLPKVDRFIGSVDDIADMLIKGYQEV